MKIFTTKHQSNNFLCYNDASSFSLFTISIYCVCSFIIWVKEVTIEAPSLIALVGVRGFIVVAD